MRHNRFHRSRGFTLIEAALTTVIIGVGVVSMLELLAKGTSANVDSTSLSMGTNLVKNIREATLQHTFASLPSLNNHEYSPAIDSAWHAISDMDNWKQVVHVNAVDPERLTVNVVDATPQAVRVKVDVMRSGEFVCSGSWIVFSPADPP